MVESASPSWFALHVRSRREKLVFIQLRAKAHEVFLPLYSTRHKWADRLKTVQVPLFPGYVFCRIAERDRTSVISTSGVIDIVRAGLRPAAIPQDEISAIQRAVHSPLLMEPYSGLLRGQRVIISGGPLSGLRGELVEAKKNFRLVLTVELLQRSVLVEIERDWVIPLGDVKSAYVNLLDGRRVGVA